MQDRTGTSEMIMYEMTLSIDFGEVGHRHARSPFRVRLDATPLAELISGAADAHPTRRSCQGRLDRSQPRGRGHHQAVSHPGPSGAPGRPDRRFRGGGVPVRCITGMPVIRAFPLYGGATSDLWFQPQNEPTKPVKASLTAGQKGERHAKPSQ